MANYTCVFVDVDKTTKWNNSESFTIDSADPLSAAKYYKTRALEHGTELGPFVMIKGDDGDTDYVKIEDFQGGKKSSPDAIAQDPAQHLLKEILAEQKQANETLKKIRWSLLVIHVILVLWYVFGWVIKPM